MLSILNNLALATLEGRGTKELIHNTQLTAANTKMAVIWTDIHNKKYAEYADIKHDTTGEISKAILISLLAKSQNYKKRQVILKANHKTFIIFMEKVNLMILNEIK